MSSGETIVDVVLGDLKRFLGPASVVTGLDSGRINWIVGRQGGGLCCVPVVARAGEWEVWVTLVGVDIGIPKGMKV